MNLSLIDWGIVVFLAVVLVIGARISKRHMQSVADFLAAGRTGGRYLIAVSGGAAGLGAITVVAYFEQNYLAGFAMTWWGLTMSVVVLVITISGWVVYRFRQTRAMTMAQFFEMRYSRNFRVFAGMLSFFGGIINFGIFPAVGARFFIYFCGLPDDFAVLGLEIPTYPLLMILLIAFSLYFVFAAGQIAIIVTDFVQGTFIHIVFVIMILYLLSILDYGQILAGLQTAPRDASMINPFKTSAARDFNIWFFLIGVFGNIYNKLSWQGEQAYNSSAKSAHEAKMGGVLVNWRELPRNLFFLVVPIVAYVVMHQPEYSKLVQSVNGVLDGIDGKALRSQATTPLILSHLLPVGLMGAFAAVMLGAFVSTHDTYLHSWGSIFIQDIVLPLRKKPLTPAQHLRFLRFSIIGVAVFIFLFSLLFQQSQYILLFFAITGAIFVGGSGAVIIGGLYWKRGTTTAAFAALITGSVVAVGGIIIHQLEPDFFINGQVFYFLAMVISSIVYIVVSLLGRKSPSDFDQLLKRGKYALKDEYKIVDAAPVRGLRMLGMGKEFTRGDKAIYLATYAWILSWFVVFVVGTIYNLYTEVSDLAWMRFWSIYLAIQVITVIIVTVWFTIGGFKDVKFMLQRLGTMQRDPSDDGRIRTQPQVDTTKKPQTEM